MIDGRMVRVGVWVQGESTQTLGNKPTYIKDRDSYISISDNVTGRFNSQIDITRNVNTVTEMTNLIDATRAYEANANALDASKSMALTGLRIGK